MTTYTNMTTPASFGVEWIMGETGNRYQLINIRGTETLMFGVKRADGDRWHTTTVVDPSRFGLDSPPKSYRAFMEVVRRYVEE